MNDDALLKLYSKTKIIWSFIFELDKSKPEVISGMNEIVCLYGRIIETTYSSSNNRGMKIVNSDLREMAGHLKRSELFALNNLLIAAGHETVNG